jgi:phage shock protein PspC (stress-responsive transcriptional regulator)
MNDLPRPNETPRSAARDEWRRDTAGRKIAGVCAGLADAFGVSVTLVRAAFVLLALPPFSGIGIVLYLVLWFLMPAEGDSSGLDRAVDKLARLVTEPPRRPRPRARHDGFEGDEGY